MVISHNNQTCTLVFHFNMVSRISWILNSNCQVIYLHISSGSSHQIPNFIWQQTYHWTHTYWIEALGCYAAHLSKPVKPAFCALVFSFFILTRQRTKIITEAVNITAPPTPAPTPMPKAVPRETFGLIVQYNHIKGAFVCVYTVCMCMCSIWSWILGICQ